MGSALHQTVAAGVFAAAALAALPRAQQPAPFDLVIRNGRIVDGTGNPWYRADVAIRGDQIARIATSIADPAARVVDAAGQVVTPGFIDIHSHASENIFDVPAAENYLRQGVTTVIGGPDGGSPVPLRPFLTEVEALQKAINFGSFVGQGSIRSAVIGSVDRKPTAAEMESMRGLVEQGMHDGAFGLSSGLFYVPGTFSTTDEVIELAKVAARLGGTYISHMRDEAAGVADSVRETIAIGERAGLPTQVTHHKIIGPRNYGRSAETLGLIDEARRRGVDATIDQYPYTASSTNIQAALFPNWAEEGGRERVLARLADRAVRGDIRIAIAQIIRDDRGGGDPKNVVIANCSWDPSLAGKTLADITRMRGMEPTLENAAEAAMWIVEQGNCSGIYHAIGEDDLQRILRHPSTMVASDGGIPVFGRAAPHPRSYGTFARVLGVYVRERNLLTLEEAVRKMSGFPAQRLGLGERGLLKPGMKADVAVFDPVRVRDLATFEKPHQYAEGVSYVVVNGQIALDPAGVTAARPGRVLYGPSKKM
jgi:dihydroorotase/N-acyl-D-amino-acid deacylase